MIDKEIFIELLRESLGKMFYRPVVEGIAEHLIANDAIIQKHGRWEYGRCSNCQEEALSTSWDEPIYDYDWEENLRYAYTETHTEYHLTSYCPNCGTKMDLED